MNTPAHLIFGAAAFARPGERAVNIAALAGSLLPDLSLFVLAGWALYVQGQPAGVVFGQLYFSEAWQGVFAIDNSLPLWGTGLALALWRHHAAATAFAGSGLLHLGLDFVLHNEDARRQFWPISDWMFRSPFSYWDPARYGTVIGPLEVILSVVLLVVLWRRFAGRLARGLILAGAVLELMPRTLVALVMGH